jgi:hypothetical protein
VFGEDAFLPAHDSSVEKFILLRIKPREHSRNRKSVLYFKSME